MKLRCTKENCAIFRPPGIWFTFNQFDVVCIKS